MLLPERKHGPQPRRSDRVLKVVCGRARKLLGQAGKLGDGFLADPAAPELAACHFHSLIEKLRKCFMEFTDGLRELETPRGYPIVSTRAHLRAHR